MTYKNLFTESINAHLSVIEDLKKLEGQIARVCEMCLFSVKSGHRIIFCGNGGSAADSQHLAAELIGKFLIDRRPLPALALTVNTSQMTAIGNDFGFEYIFSREIEANGSKGDVLIALSTSGNSQNVINAAEKANSLGIKVVGLTGKTGGKLIECADECICIPSTSTPRIQEAHILVGHIICEAIESGAC